MSAPKYRLTYFNARGFAETARMLFVLAGQDYEDKRMERDEWPTIKPNTPFGQVPMLEVNGVKIAQTSAIYRYLAKQFGYAGANPEEEARADMIAECIKDMVQGLMKIRTEADEAKKAEIKKDLVENTLPPQLECMNAFIGNQKFFLGDKVSWADLVYFNMFPFYKFMGIDLPYDKYPALRDLSDRVAAIPEIAEWIKNRPVTEM